MNNNREPQKNRKRLPLKRVLLYFFGLSAAVFVIFPFWDYAIARWITDTVYTFDWRANLADAFLYGAFGTMAIAFYDRNKKEESE